MLLETPTPRTESEAVTKKQAVRYGIIGPSGIAQRRVMPAFQKTRASVLSAIVSRSRDRAEALAAQHPSATAHGDIAEMLTEVDAVYVATPVHCHLDDARRVLEAGRHLLIEKPLARTAGEAREIVALREQGNCFAMEAYMMKFHPAHTAIREAVQLGKIGRVVQVRARLGCWYPDQPGAWRQDQTLSGGGALMDLGSHLIDLLRWMLGPIRRLQALCNTQLFSYNVEDSATAILEFESGAHGAIETFFSMPDRAGTGLLELIGTEGRIVAHDTIGQNGGGRVHWEYFPLQAGYNARQEGEAKAAETRETSHPSTDLYAAQLDYFSECILQGIPPKLNRLEEGLETLEWIERAYLAARL